MVCGKKNKNAGWTFAVTMETFLNNTKSAICVEQIAVKSSGTVIHQKIAKNKLIFSVEKTADDIGSVSDFYANIKNIYCIKKWKNKFYTLSRCTDKWIFSNGNTEYKRWIIDFEDNKKCHVVYGDVTPLYAADIRNDILKICDFDETPEIFFIDFEGNETLCSRKENSETES